MITNQCPKLNNIDQLIPKLINNTNHSPFLSWISSHLCSLSNFLCIFDSKSKMWVFVSSKCLSLLSIYIYMWESVCLILIVCISFFFFIYCYLCELWSVWMCTWYKYNITLYNLITKKYKGFVTCVYCYYVIIIFCYKTSDSKKKVKLVIVKCIIYV